MSGAAEGNQVGGWKIVGYREVQTEFRLEMIKTVHRG
jgi:hypothetical protein